MSDTFGKPFIDFTNPLVFVYKLPYRRMSKIKSTIAKLAGKIIYRILNGYYVFRKKIPPLYFKKILFSYKSVDFQRTIKL